MGHYAKKVVSLLASWHTEAVKTFCVNDLYNLNNTTNHDRQERRASKMENSPNVTLKPGDKSLTSSNIFFFRHSFLLQICKNVLQYVPRSRNHDF